MDQIKKILNSQKVAPYVFTLPFILTFCIFFVYPLINTGVMSFQSVLPGKSEFIGLQNLVVLKLYSIVPTSGYGLEANNLSTNLYLKHKGL